MAGRAPNILWIVTTQWRAQACGYRGDPNARTPALDALAAEGIDFAQAVTPHPFGPWARAAVLTGTESPANGVREYFDPLPAGARTVAHVLAERGYATGFFGKWHLARRDPHVPLVGEAHARMRVPPEARGGFGVWDGFEGGFQLNDPWLHGWRTVEPVQVRGYQSAVVMARAAEFVAERRNGGRPWFAVASVEPPHPPYAAPADGVAAPAPETLHLVSNVPRGGAVEARARRELAGYYAHVTATDRAIGALAAAAGDDAWVVVTSVHGDMHGAHGLFRKGWPYEESVRIPLVVRPPRSAAGTPARGRNEALVGLTDLSGWAAAWADGRDGWLDSERETQTISMPSVVALPDQCDRVWRGGRTRSEKLVLNADGTPWLYFDLALDPGEERNLVTEPAAAERIEAMRRRIG
jgi:arylsulfatase A-like enzyme